MATFFFKFSFLNETYILIQVSLIFSSVQLKLSEHWLVQTIILTNVHQDIWRHMTSLGHGKLTHLLPDHAEGDQNHYIWLLQKHTVKSLT